MWRVARVDGRRRRVFCGFPLIFAYRLAAQCLLSRALHLFSSCHLCRAAGRDRTPRAAARPARAGRRGEHADSGQDDTSSRKRSPGRVNRAF